MENREFYIDSDGIRLHARLDFPAESREQYPLVIVIHGFTGHMEERHIVAVSQAMNETGYATLRVEMYGHGGSDGAFCDHTLYKWINNALSVVDYARAQDWVSDLYLCGHSQGGLLTILVGAMERDVFKAIIAMSPALLIPDAARAGNMLGGVFDPMHIPDLIDMGEGRVLKGNYFRVAQSIDAWTAVDRYEGPVLLIHGDADEAVPVEYSYKAAERYKNAELVIIAGDDHCYNSHLDQVTESIRAFLTRD